MLYVILVAGLAGIPLIYAGMICWYRPFFQEESNQTRKPFASKQEIVVIVLAEIAFIQLWRKEGIPGSFDLLFQLLYVMLAGTTVLCMTDFWERVVPNRILGVLLWIFILLAGFQAVRDMGILLRLFPSILLGFLFCFLSFGLGYLLSHKNMGAGDVKLAMVMGLYLTGEYAPGAVLYGCVAAAIYSVVQMIRKKLVRTDQIPFVPFLYLGLIFRYLAG